MTADDAVFEGLSLDRLHERRSAKWSMHAPDVLPSHYAEMDFAPAPAIRARLEAALAGGDLGYAHAERSRLGPVFAGFAARRWGWAVDPGAVVAVPDVMVGVAELLRALTEPGVGVVITTPLYPPFFSVISETGSSGGRGAAARGRRAESVAPGRYPRRVRRRRSCAAVV